MNGSKNENEIKKIKKKQFLCVHFETVIKRAF